MMLVDEGKVKLDDPVEKYLPEFKGQMVVDPTDPTHTPHPAKHPIIIREIMSHTSGIPFRPLDETGPLDTRPLAKEVAVYASHPLIFQPGTAYSYSNAGIGTAARIVEVVSGTPYETFLQQRLFDPLGHDRHDLLAHFGAGRAAGQIVRGSGPGGIALGRAALAAR